MYFDHVWNLNVYNVWYLSGFMYWVLLSTNLSITRFRLLPAVINIRLSDLTVSGQRLETLTPRFQTAQLVLCVCVRGVSAINKVTVDWAELDSVG